MQVKASYQPKAVDVEVTVDPRAAVVAAAWVALGLPSTALTVEARGYGNGVPVWPIPDLRTGTQCGMARDSAPVEDRELRWLCRPGMIDGPPSRALRVATPEDVAVVEACAALLKALAAVRAQGGTC